MEQQLVVEKKEIPPPATAWMDLESTPTSEISPRKREQWREMLYRCKQIDIDHKPKSTITSLI